MIQHQLVICVWGTHKTLGSFIVLHLLVLHVHLLVIPLMLQGNGSCCRLRCAHCAEILCRGHRSLVHGSRRGVVKVHWELGDAGLVCQDDSLQSG